jgi:hypothetical protein
MLNSAVDVSVIVASDNQLTSAAKIIVVVGALATWTSTLNTFVLFIPCSPWWF